MKRICGSIFVLTIILIGTCFITLSESYQIKTGHDAVMFLNRFGYVDKEDMNVKPEMEMKMAEPMLKTYQKMCGLNMTGKLDSETMKMMNTPRCGNRDMKSEDHHFVHGRKKRYVLYSASTKWNKPMVTYKISMFSERMGIQVTEKQVMDEVKRAFEIFMEHIPIDFVHEPRMPKVDIDLAFTSQFHMQDAFPFDGPGSTLAHAFPPGNHKTSGMVHFDDVEDWTVNSPKGTNVLYVAVHEIGHALGLSHSTTKGAIMFPSYGGYRPILKLHDDDINGLQALYGKRQGMQLPPVFHPKVAAHPATTRATVLYEPPIATTSRYWNNNVIPNRDRGGRPQYTPPVADKRFPKLDKDPRNLCSDPKIDAITTLDDGNIYVFKGDYVFQLSNTGQGVNSGWPKHINSVFNGLPGNLDAALTLGNKKSYFLKGNKYWRTSGTKIDRGYPKSISSNFIGIPNNVDAAFTNFGKVYFTKGDKYWGFDPKEKPFVSPLYPLSIEKWGLKGKIDAAFVAPHGPIYFFRDDQYWKFDDTTFRVAQSEPAYPRSSKVMWFGCSAYRPDLRSIRDSSKFSEQQFYANNDQSPFRGHRSNDHSITISDPAIRRRYKLDANSGSSNRYEILSYYE